MNTSLSIYLDLIRLLAAALVVFGHSFNFTHGYFKALAGHGPAAVAVFFVLSGFVIAFVTDSKEKNWRDYTVSRAARIYSVALSAIIITMIADQIGFHINAIPYSGYSIGNEQVFHSSYFYPHWTTLDVTRMLTFTNEIWQSHVQVGSGEPYWSLGFEVWYYVIFGFYLFSPFKGVGRYVPALICAAIAGPKICLYLPLWLFGVWTYQLLKKAGPKLTAKLPTPLFLVGFFMGPVMYLLARHYIAASTQSMFLPVGWNEETVVTVLYFHFIGLLFALNLVCFYGISQRFNPVSQALFKLKKPIQWAAGATFTLYLVHQPLLLACLAINPFPAGGAAWAYTSVLTTFFLVFVIAEATERRKNLWRRAFTTLLGSGHPTARTTTAS